MFAAAIPAIVAAVSSAAGSAGLISATTAGIIGAVSTAAGAGLTAMSANQASKANAAAANAQAQQQQMNATAQATGERQQSDLVLSRQRAIAGASGVQLDNSPLQIMLDSAKNAELQAQRTIYSGNVNANMSRYAANIYNAQGRNALYAGAAKAGPSAGGLLTNLYNAYGPSSKTLSQYAAVLN